MQDIVFVELLKNQSRHARLNYEDDQEEHNERDSSEYQHVRQHTSLITANIISFEYSQSLHRKNGI